MTNLTESNEIVWSYCQQCRRDTKHEIVYSIEDVTDPQDEGPPFTIVERHQVLTCRGCEGHTFRRGFAIWEDEIDWTWSIYPEKSVDRKPDLMTFFLPSQVKTLYLETLEAHNGKANILASAGIRATVEAVCKDQGFLKGDLKSKINDMCGAGVLTENNAEYLHQHRFLGNEAVHDMQAPPVDEFRLALEMLEHLLKSLYEIPRRSKQFIKLREHRGAQTQ